MKTLPALAIAFATMLVDCPPPASASERSSTLRPDLRRTAPVYPPPSDLPTRESGDDHGRPPFHDAVWATGQLFYRDQQWVYVPGHWARPLSRSTSVVPGPPPFRGAIWTPPQSVYRDHKWIWIPSHWARRL